MKPQVINDDEVIQDNEPPKRSKYVVFKNTGIIDIRGITTFGISVKSEDNVNPIGYFGTGLKYALAVLLREEIPITIYAGLEELRFKIRSEAMRGKVFNVVCMNDTPLGFTTELGKNWELWQAFRELYSNCIDEFGRTDKVDLMPEPLEGITQVIVESERFVEVFENRSEIFLEGAPLVEPAHAKIHGGGSNHVFYRGIRIGSFKTPLMYRYNIQKHLDLTEDRTVKYAFQINDSIVDAVISSNDEKFIESILTAHEQTHEASLDFCDNRAEQSETFRKVAAELRRTRPEKTNRSAINLFERNLKAMDKFAQYKPTTEEQEALTKAIDFLAKIGFYVEKFPLVFVETLGETTIAVAEDGKIILSRRLLQMGVKQMASTLLEEFVHNDYGYADCTRTMQTFLFDQIITMGEKVVGETL